MLEYSILDPNKSELSSNITVKIEEGKYKDTILTYDPIILDEEFMIKYGIEFEMLVINGRRKTGTVRDYIQDSDADIFYSQLNEIFLDLLILFKGNIDYDK